MEFALFMSAFVAIAGFFFWLDARATKKRKAAWTLVAETMGLKFDGQRITGRFEGVDLSVQIVVRGSGKNRQVYTVFVFALTNLPRHLWIAAEGFLSKVTKLLGSQDVQLGLPELDPKLMVKGKDEDEVRAWAQHSQVTNSLKQLVRPAGGAWQIEADELRFEKSSAIADAQHVEAVIRQFVSIAAGLSSKSSEVVARNTAEADDAVEEFEENLW